MNKSEKVSLRVATKRRREKGERLTPLRSIRAFCAECMGYDLNEIEKCTAPECWLYPWRFGRKIKIAEKQGSDAV